MIIATLLADSFVTIPNCALGIYFDLSFMFDQDVILNVGASLDKNPQSVMAVKRKLS